MLFTTINIGLKNNKYCSNTQNTVEKNNKGHKGQNVFLSYHTVKENIPFKANDIKRQ